jgi:hypothetical protein
VVGLPPSPVPHKLYFAQMESAVTLIFLREGGFAALSQKRCFFW